MFKNFLEGGRESLTQTRNFVDSTTYSDDVQTDIFYSTIYIVYRKEIEIDYISRKYCVILENDCVILEKGLRNTRK